MNIGGKNGTLQHSASGGEAVDKNGKVPYTDFNKLQKNRKKAKNGRRPELSKKGRDFSTQTVIRSIRWEVNP